MAYKIIASNLANETYQLNITYLEEYWTKKEVVNFIKKVEDVVAILKISPETFQTWNKDAAIRKIEIVKQITLYYQINEAKVELLLFFNNYQDPQKLENLL